MFPSLLDGVYGYCADLVSKAGLDVELEFVVDMEDLGYVVGKALLCDVIPEDARGFLHDDGPCGLEQKVEGRVSGAGG